MSSRKDRRPLHLELSTSPVIRFSVRSPCSVRFSPFSRSYFSIHPLLTRATLVILHSFTSFIFPLIQLWVDLSACSLCSGHFTVATAHSMQAQSIGHNNNCYRREITRLRSSATSATVGTNFTWIIILRGPRSIALDCQLPYWSKPAYFHSAV